MTAPTHKQYAITFAYLALILFYKYNVTNINYYLCIPIMLVTSKAGALFPDIDHEWQNVKEKTTLNRIINFLIHITGGKHRSWQTHSIDIWCWCTLASIIIPLRLYNTCMISIVNKEVLSLLLLGFMCGWLSHLFSDAMTSAGVRLFCFSKFKIKFVPKHIGKLKFNTGNEWEHFNYTVARVVNFVLAIICIMYPFLIKWLTLYIVK